jgi:hypothetical protein
MYSKKHTILNRVNIPYFYENQKKLGINARGQMTFSTYDFNPDKYNLSIGSYLRLRNLEVRANLQTEATDYDEQRETQNSVTLQGSLRF